MKLFTILYFVLTTLTFSQTSSLVGEIHNKQTGEGIPFVNIGVEGTYFGTSSNEHGKFKLTLKNGSHNLIISCVGYGTHKISVTVPNENGILINLEPIPIELPEVIVTADENPAYSIIRKAIADKERNKKGLLNYYYDFYSKSVLKSGKEIMLIEEDVGEGLKTLPDDVKEHKTLLFKTKNIAKADFQKFDLNILVKKVIDFTNDSLSLGLFVLHLPIAKLAFDYYDYRLIGVQQSGKHNYYKIKVIPLSKIRPSLKGEILIDDSSYALTGLNLTLENRNLIPFTKFKMSIIQNLINYKNYWLPKYYNVDVEFSSNYYNLISLDSLNTTYIKVFNNFATNVNKNDSLLKNINGLVSLDSLITAYKKVHNDYSDSLMQNLIRLADTTFSIKPKIITQSEMDSIRLYPLSLAEKKAYQNIDSTKDIVSSLKLGGIGGEYIKHTDFKKMDEEQNKGNQKFGVGKLFKYANIQNNRVDGILLGLRYSNWISDVLNISLRTGYTLARKDVKTNLSFYVPIKHSFIDGIELTGNYGTKPLNVFSPYSDLWNSIAVTLGFEDQFNYLFSKGGTLSVKKYLGKNISAELGFTIESQKSVNAIKYYSIFSSKRNVRLNPEIMDGADNRIVLNFESGSSPFKTSFTTTSGFISQIEFSSKLFGSKFNYTRINAAYQFHIKPFYDELFFSPYLGVYIEASAVLGSFGPQHLYTPQTALGVYSPFGTFKALHPYQLIGDKSIAVHLEYDWRKTFFDMLGIYFPVAWNIELTTGVNGLRIWNNSGYLSNINSNKYYWEIYGGISGILGIININAAYNSFKNVVVRFEFSKFF